MRNLIFSLLFLLSIGRVVAHEGDYVWHRYNQIDKFEESALMFSSNSQSIIVRYRVDKESVTSKSKPYIDLSFTDNNGQLRMISGDVSIGDGEYFFSFSDGISYSAPAIKGGGYEFAIWLPTMCEVEMLEVGVKGDSFFEFSQPREESPIVVYCEGDGRATTAGYSLVATISRRLERVAKEVESVKVATTQSAKAFVISGNTKRLIKGVKSLCLQHPLTPVIIDSEVVLDGLQRYGFANLYFTYSSYDGSSYENKIREVLNCRVGEISTTIPVSQRRVPSHRWSNQCQYIIRDIKSSQAKSAIIGNSIVHNWGGNPAFEQRMPNVEGQESWNRYMGDFVNLGIGADRIENLLWRVYNDQMEIKEFERIIIMIGTNNLNNQTSNDDILLGVENLVEQIKIRQPNAKIILLGILPRKDIGWDELQKINNEYAKIADRQGITYKNIGRVLMDENNIPRDEFYRKRDRVHPSAMGYEELGKVIGTL